MGAGERVEPQPVRPAAQTRASVWRGASPGRFLYGRGADAGIAPEPSTIVETRAGVAPRRPPPPPLFLPAPRAWDAAACANARQAEGQSPRVSARRDSEGGGGDGRTRPVEPRRSSRLGSRRREGPRPPWLPGASALSPPPTGRCCPLAAATTRAPGAAPPPGGRPVPDARSAHHSERRVRRTQARRGPVARGDGVPGPTPSPPSPWPCSEFWKMDAPGGQPERSSAHPTAAALGGAPCALLCRGSAGDPTELGIKPSCRLPAGLWPRSYPVIEVLSWVTRNRLQDVRP